MARRMPPLNALRAFEAAARHLSFKEAARELFVTPGAVSQQIKRLEDELGITLFHRFTRSIALTDAGNAYFPAVRQAFQGILEATDDLAPGRHAQVLNVNMYPSLAVKWLVPRLGRFSQRHPDIEVRVFTSPHLVDFANENVDVGIREGSGRYPGLRIDPMAPGDRLPVCSPRLLQEGPTLQEPVDLVRHTLLHDDRRRDWPAWVDAVGVTQVDAERGPGFSDDGLVLQAAIEGQGIALSSRLLVSDDVAAGRLVCPLGPPVDTGESVYVVSPRATADVAKVVAFRDWVLGEASATVEHFLAA